MPVQQAEPKAESFGFQDTVQEHVPPEDRVEDRPKSSGKRQVAVSRRGPNTKRAAARLDDLESDAGTDDGDIDDDLDASADLDADDADPDTDADGGEDLDAAGDDEAGGDADGEKPHRQARSVSDKDAKTRGQWKEAYDKQQKDLEALQRRLDGQESRNQQADDAQRQRQAGAQDDSEDELDTMLDEMTGAGEDKDGFVKVGDQKAQEKSRKKLKKHIDGQVNGAVESFAREDIKALFGIPGASDAWNEAKRTGLADRLAKEHRHQSPLMYAIVKEQHSATVAKLEARHKTELGKMKEQLRRYRLGEIPTGQGNRGAAGTGNGRSASRGNDMFATMDALSKKQGIPASR